MLSSLSKSSTFETNERKGLLMSARGNCGSLMELATYKNPVKLVDIEDALKAEHWVEPASEIH